MPIREALRRLEAQSTLALCSGRTLAVLQVTRAELLEIRDMRMALEGLAVEKAAGRCSWSELEEANCLCAETEEAAWRNDHAAYLDKSRAFHFAIYRAAGQSFLKGISETLRLRIGPFRNFYIEDRRHMETAIVHHWRVQGALRRGDGEAARAAILANMAEAAEDLLQFVSDGAARRTPKASDRRRLAPNDV